MIRSRAPSLHSVMSTQNVRDNNKNNIITFYVVHCCYTTQTDKNQTNQRFQPKSNTNRRLRRSLSVTRRRVRDG